MGSFARLSGGTAAVIAGMAAIAAPSAAMAAPSATVVIPCSVSALDTAINQANLTTTPTTIVLQRNCNYSVARAGDRGHRVPADQAEHHAVRRTGHGAQPQPVHDPELPRP